MVSTTPQPLYPREVPGTHCAGGWVGPRAGLDVCEISRPHRDFFWYHSWPFDLFDLLVVRVTNMGQIILLLLPKEGMLWIFPAGKISPPTGIRSQDCPACSQSLYRLSYPAHIYWCIQVDNYFLYCYLQIDCFYSSRCIFVRILYIVA
jgi:hypothetical protein